MPAMPDKPRKSSVTCYNLIFPVWLLFSPLGMPILVWLGPLGGWLVLAMLAGNFAVDWLVTALGLKLAGVGDIRQRVWRVILRVWLFGYAADAVSILPLILLMRHPAESDWFDANIEFPLLYGNPFTSPPALLILAACLLLAGVLIYFFNMKWGLKNANLEQRDRRRVALTLALLTMPYTFLIPTSLTYV